MSFDRELEAAAQLLSVLIGCKPDPVLTGIEVGLAQEVPGPEASQFNGLGLAMTSIRTVRFARVRNRDLGHRGYVEFLAISLKER